MEMRWEQNVVWNWTLGRGKHILRNHGRNPIISSIDSKGLKNGQKEAPHKLQCKFHPDILIRGFLGPYVRNVILSHIYCKSSGLWSIIIYIMCGIELNSSSLGVW